MGSDELRKALVYDGETGHFTRLGDARTSASGFAGTINNNGYRLIRVGKHRHRAHRLAWLYVHGEWPTGEIDHLNGVRDDNRIANLRDVSNLINQQNRRSALKHGKTGLLGATTTKKGRFRAAIHTSGRCIHLGVFDTALEAHQAYVEAKRELHPGCTI